MIKLIRLVRFFLIILGTAVLMVVLSMIVLTKNCQAIQILSTHQGRISFSLVNLLGNEYEPANCSFPPIIVSTETPKATSSVEKANTTLTGNIYQGTVIYTVDTGYLQIFDTKFNTSIGVRIDTDTKIFNESNQLTNFSYIKNDFIVKVVQSSDISKMADGAITASEIRVITK